MRPAIRLVPTALALAIAAGCASAPNEPFEPQGEVARMVAAAAQSSNVPVELMLAMAHIEGGLRLAPTREVHEDELVSIAGALELRHGAFNSLARGAELTGRTELELQADTALGTEAGARVLDDIARHQGIPRDSMEAWASVVEEMSGHRLERERVDYRARVFKLLRRGGALPARGGEVITLPPNEEIPIALTISPPPLYALDMSDSGLPDVQWFETPSKDKWLAGRQGNSVSMIAIHDTEGGWDASVATLQNDPGKSVHYIVDADGSRVGQFIHESDTGYHVGNFYYNLRMIGIEHVGYAGKDDYQAAMYAKSADLVKDIAERNNLKVDRDTLIAHQEVPNGQKIPSDSAPCTKSPGQCVQDSSYGGANHHTDPGIYWEWCQYMELAGGSCKCNDTFELWNCVHDLSMMNRCANGVVEIVHCADACVVEPIGTNDHCTPVSPSSSSSSTGGGSGGGGGAGGDTSASGAGVGGGGTGSGDTGGGAATGGATSGGATSGGSSGDSGGCSCAAVGGRTNALTGSALALAAALALRARRRRTAGK